MQAAKEATKQFYPASVPIKQQQTMWQATHKGVRSGTMSTVANTYPVGPQAHSTGGNPCLVVEI